jgi:hypothetical protein
MRRCMKPGCTEEAILRFPGLEHEWMCERHAQEQMNLPENVEANQAIEDLDEFLDKGGRTS